MSDNQPAWTAKPNDSKPKGDDFKLNGIIMINPATGKKEQVTNGYAGLWVFLFGAFYFFYKGMWMEAVLWTIIAIIVALPTMGLGYLVLQIILWFTIGNLIRNNYRKNGWKDVV